MSTFADTLAAPAIDADKAWIITYSGLKFYHLNPQPEMVRIEDIAHSLSQLCRWTGHSRYHYSVAQHCVYASLICPPELALECLMHDSSEAYLGDMNRPLKHFTAAGPAYLQIEEKIERVIFNKFGLPFPMSEGVKVYDVQMLYAEKDQLMAEVSQYEPRKWGMNETRANVIISEWTPRFAEEVFLKRFKELYKEKQ
jgi:hypothetical protein